MLSASCRASVVEIFIHDQEPRLNARYLDPSLWLLIFTCSWGMPLLIALQSGIKKPPLWAAAGVGAGLVVDVVYEAGCEAYGFFAGEDHDVVAVVDDDALVSV